MKAKKEKFTFTPILLRQKIPAANAVVIVPANQAAKKSAVVAEAAIANKPF
ncbi:hypothetical protein [Geofilum rubicundum]|uniref:hypothetical protein n=1 Tax=Geofilum rubicundum TaxID=472113 RepID=UPI0012FCF941|nr:hypothetical protein [Geofilum rubicundum]